MTGVDVELLKREIRRTYAAVSAEPDCEFMFPTGCAWAADLGYPEPLLARVPERSAESFAGVANPFSLGALAAGEDVLDVGCGAGLDVLVAAQMVGTEGSVTGLDMTRRTGERGAERRGDRSKLGWLRLSSRACA